MRQPLKPTTTLKPCLKLWSLNPKTQNPAFYLSLSLPQQTQTHSHTLHYFFCFSYNNTWWGLRGWWGCSKLQLTIFFFFLSLYIFGCWYLKWKLKHRRPKCGTKLRIENSLRWWVNVSTNPLGRSWWVALWWLLMAMSRGIITVLWNFMEFSRYLCSLEPSFIR